MNAAFSCIDCQSHVFPPELLGFLENRREPPLIYKKDGETFIVVKNWVRKLLPKHSDITAKLADMDSNEIGMTALSINDPGPELFGSEGSVAAQISNDGIANIVRRHPGRFFGLAVLPLQNMSKAMAELERCRTGLGMKGILLYSNINGKFPDEPEFRPLFRRAEETGLPLVLHPAYPTTYEAVRGHEMVAGLGLMFDTTIALTRIILCGILEEHPRLKLVCPHAGGALPYLIGRIDHQTQVLRRGCGAISKAPSEYLRQVYLDTMTPSAGAIRYALEFVGPDRLIFGTDHPWVDSQLTVRNIQSLGLDSETEKRIFSTNARKLFNV
jgi:predicted TIM-barrel fold metal-dependent hydrolase